MERLLIIVLLTIITMMFGVFFFWLTRGKVFWPVSRSIQFKDENRLDSSLALFHFTSYIFILVLTIYLIFALLLVLTGGSSTKAKENPATTETGAKDNSDSPERRTKDKLSTTDIDVVDQFTAWYLSKLKEAEPAASVVIVIFTFAIYLIPLFVAKVGADCLTALVIWSYVLNEKAELKLLEKTQKTAEDIHNEVVRVPEGERHAIVSLENALRTLEEIKPHKWATIPLIISSDSRMVGLSKGLQVAPLFIVAQRIWFYNNWYSIKPSEYFPKGDPQRTLSTNINDICNELNNALNDSIRKCLTKLKENYEQLFGVPLKTSYADQPRSIRLVFGNERALISSSKSLYYLLNSESLYPIPVQKAADISEEASEIAEKAEDIGQGAEIIKEEAKTKKETTMEEKAEVIEEEVGIIEDKSQDIIGIANSIGATRKEGVINIWISDSVGRRMKVDEWTPNNESFALSNLFDKPSCDWEKLLPEYIKSMGQSVEPTLFEDVRNFGNNWPDHDFLAIGGKMYLPGYKAEPTINNQAAFQGFIGLLPIVLMGLNYKFALPFLELTEFLSDKPENLFEFYEKRLLEFQTKGIIS